MISLEQVKLLETKVIKALDFITQSSAENAALREKLESYQKRIGDLEILVKQFKEDQSRIEEGILSALDRLNQFEKAIEKSLKEKQPAASANTQNAAVQTAAARPQAAKSAAAAQSADGGNEKIFFEIPESEADDDTSDSLEDALDDAPAGETEPDKSELDIF